MEATPSISYTNRFKALRRGYENEESLNNLANEDKRRLYSELQILLMDVESDKRFNTSSAGIVLKESIEEISKSLDLDYCKRDYKWYKMFDDIFRFIGVWAAFMSFAIFLSIPVIVITFIDEKLTKWGILSRKYQLAPMLQRMMANTVLTISGVDLISQGLEQSDNNENDNNTNSSSGNSNSNKTKSKNGNGVVAMDCFNEDKTRTVLFFTHASTLDAFIICATCPVRYTVLAKKELFLIPFFGWLLIAFGGVPINRNDRNNAVKSLNNTAKNSKAGDCVLISPEGTRSRTGQLLSFKKGPFYLWETMKATAVPVVIFGAHDLCPRGHWMSSTGKVYVRYLSPIIHSEGVDRSQMASNVRRYMLEALADCPKDVALDISWQKRGECIWYILTIFIINHIAWNHLGNFMAAYLNLTVFYAILFFLFVSIAITLILYCYVVYIIPMFDSMKGMLSCCTSASFESVEPIPGMRMSALFRSHSNLEDEDGLTDADIEMRQGMLESSNTSNSSDVP